MPQGPPELQEEFGTDYAALQIIKENYTEGKGFVIRPKVEGYKSTELENRALNYLWLEWDYGFEGC